MATLEMMSSFSPSGGSNNGHNHEHGGGQDSNATMKDATDKLKELLVAIRSVVTKYQANFDAKATQDILDRTTLLKEFIIGLDYDNMADYMEWRARLEMEFAAKLAKH